MEQLHEISDRLISSVGSGFKRSLFFRINQDERLTEITGARGTGKTTLLLQMAQKFVVAGLNVLYVSLDVPFFFRNSLFDLAETFYKYGGQVLFIDEVHKYPPKHKDSDWSRELKGIYDAFPSLKIFYTGSSVLALHKGQGDLSRRKVSYMLQGLSFREYIEFYHKIKFPVVALEDVLKSHQSISRDITDKIKVLPAFEKYLKSGYYPFYVESPENYYSKLSEIIGVVIDTDIPATSDVTYESLHKIKQLLGVITTSVPYTPNLSNLSSELYVADQRTLIKYINLLEKADLIKTLGAKAVGNKIMNKPAKIYLNNTNLMFAIDADNLHTGTLRETFFYNQVGFVNKVSYPRKGDFLVNGKYLFEVGGKNKTNKQIKGVEEAFVAADNIEVGFTNKIPLWLFGFLY